MMGGQSIEYQPEYVDIEDVPVRERRTVWGERFAALKRGKAAVLHFNTRQRAHQVRSAIRTSARYHGIKIHARIIKADMEVHGEDGYLLYYWKETPLIKQNK